MGNELKVMDYNFEQCMKCSICTAYCPVTLVNQKFPGPKQSGPDGERYRLKDIKYFDKTLEYCLNCKRCEVACPSDVKIADIIQVVRLKHATGKTSLRNRFLASTDAIGKFAVRFSPIVNTLTRTATLKGIMDSTLSIDRHRIYPLYSGLTFRKWYSRFARKSQERFNKKVTYFHGCYVNYNDPELGKSLVKILNAVGIGVSLIDEKCCGMPLIMNGFEKRAQKNAIHNINSIKSIPGDTLPVITTSSTCTLTIRDEYDHILGLENLDIRNNVILATRFLYDLIDDGKITLIFREGSGQRVAYHTSCHMEKLGWAIYSSKLLSLIPGSHTIVIDSTCCGLSGTYGFKKENYPYSQKIGKLLFDKIEKARPDIVSSDCESCKWQIEMSTSYKVLNPITLIADALDVPATRIANGLQT